MVSQIVTPTKPASSYDSGNPFIPATYAQGGGHYNWGWSIGPEWEGLSAGSSAQPMIYTLGFYKVDNQSDSYEYRESYQSGGGPLESGTYGAWLVATPTSSVPIPGAYVLMLAGFGLVRLAARRRA